MMINLKDNSEKDKYILELFQTSPKEAFRLLFDAYHMKLCIYAVQLTDSFEMAEDIVQDFFIYFWEKKYYLKINQNLRYYLYLSVRNAAINALQKNNMLSMEELSGIDMGIPEESIDEEEQEERNKLLLEKLQKLPHQELQVVRAVIMENKKYKEARKVYKEVIEKYKPLEGNKYFEKENYDKLMEAVVKKEKEAWKESNWIPFF